MSTESLPPVVQSLANQHPAIWEAYNQLNAAASAAGPLEPKLQRLVKLALAVGAGREGAVHSHVRRGLKAGLTREEIRQVALLAITTLGWSASIAALSWIDDEIQGPV
jgi:alkylhydroperoxidase/carboxymuconolactone decarboxylase family protein YurZ